MRRGFGWAVLLAVVVLAAPWASQKPDAVQKLLGLSGGASTVGKALLGVLITFAAVAILMKLLSWRGRPR